MTLDKSKTINRYIMKIDKTIINELRFRYNISQCRQTSLGQITLKIKSNFNTSSVPIV